MTEAEAKRAGAAGPGGLHELRGARDRGDLSGVALEDDPGGAARQYLATLPGDLLCTGATWARGVKEGAGEERVAPFVDTEFLGAWDYRLSVCGVWWWAVSYTHLRAHETVLDLVCRLLLEKKKKTTLPTSG